MGADEAIRCKTIYLSAMRHFIKVLAVCEASLRCLRSRRFNPLLYRSIDEEAFHHVGLTVSLLAATFVVC